MILIDTVSLYNSCKQRYEGHIDYPGLFHQIESTHKFQQKIAYIAEHDGADRFIKTFRQIPACDVRLKKPKKVKDYSEADFAVEITVDVMSLDYDKLILCTTDVRFLPLLQFLDTVDADQHVPVHVYGIGIPRVFEPYAVVTELQEKYVRF